MAGQLPLFSFGGLDEHGRQSNSGTRIVYVFETESRIKIGQTDRDDVTLRARELQTGCPDKITVRGSFVVHDETDRDIQRKFWAFERSDGGIDWFKKTPELLEAVDRLIAARQPIRYTAPVTLDWQTAPRADVVSRAFLFPCPNCGVDIFFGGQSPNDMTPPATSYRIQCRGWIRAIGETSLDGCGYYVPIRWNVLQEP